MRYHLQWLASDRDDEGQPKRPLVVRVDRDTYSRSIVATLGLGIVGAYHSERMTHADGAIPNSSTTRRFEAKLR
jgi:hypothetical protein